MGILSVYWFVYRSKMTFCCSMMPVSVVIWTIYKPFGSSLALNWQFCGVLAFVFPLKTFCNSFPSLLKTVTLMFSFCIVLKYKFSVPSKGLGFANSCRSLFVLSLPLRSMGIQNQPSVTSPIQSVMVTLYHPLNKFSNR